MAIILPDPKRLIGIRFSMLARRWRHEVESSLAEAGLSDATWAPLVHLSEGGDGQSQKHLAARLGIDASSLVRLLDILERQSLIERRPDQNDGRARRVFLTPDGEARVAHIRNLLWQAEELLLADLSDEEAQVMLDCFARIDARITDTRGAA
ncbi:MarR family transcriptional regulator [Brevundimonas sp.]|uniref:MarR family winged helix-turn-helix transcriptional regulator n=1 Tax=Brevundimonas sp. TaxID=1871086 RepID=UPI00289E4142|nr:MarR family transcriptional regulator [Brevundimonas sp.]